MLGKNIPFQIFAILFFFYCFLIHYEGATATEIYGKLVKNRNKYAAEVGLIRYNKGSEIVYCTGTIVNPDWLVTSRHCFHSGTEIGTVLVNALSSKDKAAKSIRFSQVVVHGDFQEQEGINDISLVKTESPMDQAMDTVRFAFLMKKPWPAVNRYNRSCEILHYVRDEGSSEIKLYRDDVLAEAGPSACKCKNFGYTKQPPLGALETEAICAQSKKFISSCYSHHATPLFCDKELVGIGHLIVDCESSEINFKQDLEICKNGRRNLNTFLSLSVYVHWMNSKGIFLPKSKFAKAANVYPLLNLIFVCAVYLCWF